MRVTGTIYGNANLGTLNASGTGIGTNGQILTSTGTGLAWSNNVAPSSHTHGAGDITSGTLGVARGGTGATTFSSGQLLIGNGASAVTTRAIKNMTAAGNLGWTAAATDIYIPTVNTLAYWNGRYNSSSSNLQYCNKGEFGNAVTYGVDDATANGALGTGTGLTTERSVYYGLVTVNNASQTRATGIYAPTSAGTANQILVSAGGTSAPTWKATANGAAYATGDNSSLTFGTLPIAQGGTGKTTAADAWTALGGGASGKHADSYFALASHGNHVPTTQTANNAVFLRNDNTWQTVTPANIGAATSGHTHTTTLATDSGTSSITLASAGKYKLTAGGTSVIFTMPTSNNYSHPTGDGNLHVPATSTTNNNKFLKAGSTAGSLSWTTIASVSNEILTIVS